MTMRSLRFSLTPLVTTLSRKFIDFMLHVYRDVILRGPLLNRLIPLLHILIDLLVVSAEGVVNAASNGCLRGRRFTLSGSVTVKSRGILAG